METPGESSTLIKMRSRVYTINEQLVYNMNIKRKKVNVFDFP